MAIVAAAPPRGVGVGELADELAGDQGHVAGENDHVAVGVDLGRGGAHGVARPAGLGLDGEHDAVAEAAVELAARAADDDDPPAPASRAAATDQAISGRPQRSWRTFGSFERIRVPCPAARMTTVGAVTPRQRTASAGRPALRAPAGPAAPAAPA